MFSFIVDLIDKKNDDYIEKKLDKYPIMFEYKNKLGILFFCSFIIILISLLVLLSFPEEKKNKFVQVNEENSNVYYISSKTLPNQSPKVIQRLATDIVKKSYTFNYLEWEKEIKHLNPYFTDEGWEVFYRTLENSTLMQSVQKNQLAVSATPIDKAVIIKTGSVLGNPIWMVEVPIMLSFTGNIKTVSQNILVNVTIERIPTTSNELGLGVSKFLTGKLDVNKMRK